VGGWVGVCVWACVCVCVCVCVRAREHWGSLVRDYLNLDTNRNGIPYFPPSGIQVK